MTAISVASAPLLEATSIKTVDIRLIRRRQRTIRFRICFLIVGFFCRGTRESREVHVPERELVFRFYFVSYVCFVGGVAIRSGLREGALLNLTFNKSGHWYCKGR